MSDFRVSELWLVPAAAAAPGRLSRTAAADLSFDSRVSGVDGVSRSSASFPPVQQTGRKPQKIAENAIKKNKKKDSESIQMTQKNS